MSAGSRYHEPGSIQRMWWDDRHAEPVVVLATSRHKRKLSHAEALPQLVAEWEYAYEATPKPETAEWVRWRSVTEADVAGGELDADVGSWHTEATGQAFIDVLRCDADRGGQQ